MIARTFATSLRFILVLALCEFAPAAPARIAYSSISAAMLPLFVAKDKKLFDKYGVDVELTYIRGVAIEGSIAGANAANFVDASLAQELEQEGVLQKKNR